MDYLRALNDALAATLIGTNVMMSFYRRKYRTGYKEEDGTDPHATIFTEADTHTQEAVVAFLLRRYWPEVGLLAEEGGWRTDHSRFEKAFHWQLDPIDGTKGFKDETDNFGISLALVSKEGRSFLGVLHNPARNLLAYACIGQPGMLNNVPIRPSKTKEGETVRIIVSSNQIKKPNMARALDLFPDKEVLHAESNVTKGIRVFSGEADLFFGLPNVPIHNWDLAAVAAIAESSGCTFTDFRGREIGMNPEGVFLPDGFILSNGHIHDFAMRTLSQWKED